MSKPTMVSALVVTLLSGVAGRSFGQEARPSAAEREAKLVAVLESDAQLKEKLDACRELARIGTREAVPALAALLGAGEGAGEGDQKLSHMARYALETIPDPSVDEALRAALDRLEGRPLVGVIGSVGVRRDVEAVDALAGLLRDADGHVAQAAALALGRIATPGAVDALEGALAAAPEANRLALCEGLFRCAERLGHGRSAPSGPRSPPGQGAEGSARRSRRRRTPAAGRPAADGRDRAVAIYDRLRAVPGAPHQVRAGALRGAVLARGEEGLPLLMEALRGDDFAMVEAAARIAMELPGAEVAKALADELGGLPADKQILLTQTLGRLGRAEALPALSALARSGEKPARLAAVRALPEIGDAAAVRVLVDLLGDDERDVARAAQDALAALAGPEVGDALAGLLDEPDAATRRLAIEMMGARRMAGAIPALLKAAGDADESVRAASIKVLGGLAGLAEFPALVELLVKAGSPSEIRAAERALSAICIREARPAAGAVVIRKAVYGDLPDGPSADVTKKVAEMVKAGSLSVEASNGNFGDPAPGIRKKLRMEYAVDRALEVKTVGEGETLTITAGAAPRACTDALCAALDRAPPGPKIALLRILRSARGSKALAAVRAAAADADAEVRNAAASLLCGWPSVEALPDVTRLAETAADGRVRILALRGCFRLIPLQDAPAGEKLASLGKAMALAERKEEKWLALAALAALAQDRSPASPVLQKALALVTPCLRDPELKEEASLAAVAIAKELVRSHPSRVAEAMEQVSKATANRQTARSAEKLLERARKDLPRK